MTVNTRTSELYITNWTSSSTQKWKFSNWHESQLPGGEIISKYGNYHLTVVGNKLKALSWDGSFAQKWSCLYPDTPFFQKNLPSSSTPVYVPVFLYFICIAHLNIVHFKETFLMWLQLIFYWLWRDMLRSTQLNGNFS